MMLIDYCLYWLLAKIQYYGRKQAGLEGELCNITDNELTF